MQIPGERSACAIHQIQPIVGRHPKTSRPVFIRTYHIIIAQSGGILRVMQIANKGVGLGIEAIQSAQLLKSTECLSDPERCALRTAAQAARIFGVILVPCKVAARAIEYGQALIRAEPENPLVLSSQMGQISISPKPEGSFGLPLYL